MAYGRDGGGVGPFSVLAASAILAVGIAFAGLSNRDISGEAETSERLITVSGQAERLLPSDLASWSITVARQGADLAIVAEALSADVATVRAFLQEQGFDLAEIHVEGQRLSEDAEGFLDLAQTITVRTSEIDRVTAVSLDLNPLLGLGVPARADRPIYEITALTDELNGLRRSLAAEARTVAHASAEQLAQDAGATLGPLASASDTPLVVTGEHDDGRDAQHQVFKRVRLDLQLVYALTD